MQSQLFLEKVGISDGYLKAKQFSNENTEAVKIMCEVKIIICSWALFPELIANVTLGL